MIAILTPSWELSDEHAASSYGQPVLVNRASGQAYGPADLVKPFPSWSANSGRNCVVRMLRNDQSHLSVQELLLVAKFLDSTHSVLSPEPQPVA